MVRSLCRSSKYLTPLALCQIRPKTEYYCHIWVGAAQSSLYSLDKVPMCLRILVDDELLTTSFPQTKRHKPPHYSIAISMENDHMNYIP